MSSSVTCDFLLIGCESSGKSTLAKQLMSILLLRLQLYETPIDKYHISPSNSQPQICRISPQCLLYVQTHPFCCALTLAQNGVELEKLTYKKHEYVIREIGGNFLQVWPKYYESCLIVIVRTYFHIPNTPLTTVQYVIDLTNYPQLPVACVELFNVLTHEHLRNKPVLILLNKMYVYHKSIILYI